MANIQGLQPGAREGLLAALEELKKQGIPHTLNSAYRSHQEQVNLWNDRKNNKYPVARPGTSRHEKGRAADLGIPPEYRDQANQVLSAHGWEWHGPSDEVHYDYKKSGGAGSPRPSDVLASTQAALDKYKVTVQGVLSGINKGGIENDASLSKYIVREPQEQSIADDPDVSKYIVNEPAAPAEDTRSFWDKTKDYASNYYHNVLEPGTGRNLYERGSAAFQPAVDAANYVTHGGANAVLQRTINPLMAGAKQVFKFGNQQLEDTAERFYTKYMNGDNQRMLDEADRREYNLRAGIASAEDLDWLHQHAYQIENARRPVMQWRAPWQGGPNIIPGLAGGPKWEDKRRDTVRSIARAFNGEEDPTLPRTGLFSTAVGQNNWLTQSLDILSDWKAAGKFGEMTISPILGGSTRAAGALARVEGAGGPLAGIAKAVGPAVEGGAFGLARSGLDKATEAIWERAKGNRNVAKLAEGFQQFTSGLPEFRTGQQITNEEMGPVRAGQARRDRIENLIKGYSAKLSRSGVEVTGNAFEGTRWHLPELADKFRGNLVDQFIDLYAESGGEGSFFTTPEVLAEATKRGLDPQVIMKIGDEAVNLNLHAGEQLVKSKLLEPEAFAKNAGQYTRRLYQMGQMTPTEAGAMLQELVQNGVTDTKTVALLQNLAMKGEKIGQYYEKGGMDPHKVVRERVLDTPEDRLAHLPELSYIKASSRGVVGQLRAAAAARVLERIADHDTGISAAAKIATDDWQRPPVTEQAKFKGELVRVQSRLKQSIEQFERPKTGLKAQLFELNGRLEKANAEVAHYGQAKVQHLVAEPLEPPLPKGELTPSGTGRTWKDLLKGELKPSFKDTAEVRVARQFAAKGIAKGAARAVERITDIKRNLGLEEYAKDLNKWQKSKAAWEKEGAELNEKFEVANAKRQRAAIEGDRHQQYIDQATEEAARLTRRQEILKGERPATIEDAADGLGQAMKQLDPQGLHPLTPEVESYWHQKWLDSWNRINDDIFSDVPPTGLPKVPPGLPPEIIEAMGRNNPLIATALDESLSVDAAAIAAGTEPPGWVLWGDGYGAMSGRYASQALKSFFDDAMSADRFFGGDKGAMGGISKWLGEGLRTVKLYLNAITHASVYIQSHFEGWTTVADAGAHFDPVAYHAGMKEFGNWKYKGGPETPAVKALLDAGVDMGGSFRTGVDPRIGKPYAPGEQNILSRAKEFGKSKFVDVQLFPKAGVVKILMDQGMDPIQAAQWAEKGYGGTGIVQGGIETPGVMRLLENLNRSGVAMFTSYPLHSINRIAQLMVTNPGLALQFPVLRKYLMDQAPPEVRDQDKQGLLRFTEVPIGGIFKNRDGSPVMLDMNNLTAHGAAFQPLHAATILDSWNRFQEVKARNDKSGLNPADLSNQNGAEFLKQMGVPFVSKVLLLSSALNNVTPNPYASQAQTPLQAMIAMAGVPNRDISDRLEARLNDKLHEPIKSRQTFAMDYEKRLHDGYEPEKTFNGFLDNKDVMWLRGAWIAGATKLNDLQRDKTIPNDKSFEIIRNQLDYLKAIDRKIEEGGVKLDEREAQIRALALQTAGGDASAEQAN